MGIVRYGTSSWSEKSWVGPFYPEGMRPGDFLTHYANQFSTVEADVTYYRVPGKRLTGGWNDKTPEGFSLSAKFPKSIVHCGTGRLPDASRLLVPEYVGPDTRAFLDAMRLLGDKCGPLVLQFPYFNRDAFPGPRPFLERLATYLDGLPDDFRYAVEIRNKHWLKKPLLDLLRERKVALVLLDLVYMPHPDEMPELDLLTTDFTYVRLIGDRKAVDERTEKFNRIVIDQGRRIGRWAELLKTFMDRVPLGWVYANNHFAGHGPATIRDLAKRLPEEMRG